MRVIKWTWKNTIKKEVEEFQMMFDTGIAWKININKNVNDFRRKIVEKLSTYKKEMEE